MPEKMPEKTPVPELHPPTTVIADLVQRLVGESWPTSTVERKNLFARLGFSSATLSEVTNHESPFQITALDFGFGELVPGTWDSYKGDFLGVTLHLYGSQQAADPETHRGFNDLRIQLTELFGSPEHPWDDEQAPPCSWQSHGKTITAHLFNRNDSSLMLSVEDTRLAALADDDSLMG